MVLVSAVGRTISASRLEILNEIDPESCGVLDPLGDFELSSSNKDNKDVSPIKSLEIIKKSGDGWCILVCNEDGDVNLIFVDIVDNTSTTKENEKRNIQAEFREVLIFNCFEPNQSLKEIAKDFLIRAPSIELIGTMPVGAQCSVVNVWTPSPNIYSDIKQKDNANQSKFPGKNYICTKIYHRGNTNCDNHKILDFRWMPSGHVDSFPWLITFSDKSIVIHRRAGWQSNWISIAEFTYPTRKEIRRQSQIELSSKYQGSLSPADMYPHIIASLRTVVTTNDERNYIKSDYEPDSILAAICSDPDGIDVAMRRHVGKLMSWLSKWMDPTDSTTVHWDEDSKLSCTPFEMVYDNNINIDNENESTVESATILMQSFAVGEKVESSADSLLLKLQNV